MDSNFFFREGLICLAHVIIIRSICKMAYREEELDSYLEFVKNLANEAAKIVTDSFHADVQLEFKGAFI
jgi:hypothetical protein